MSQLHVNQIAGLLERTFGHLIDMSDVQGGSDTDYRSKLLSRALAAFAVAQLSGLTPEEAAATVTDGSGDNGIDALHYDNNTKTLYVVQSKWYGGGHGSFDRADVLKLTSGFRDLVNLSFERFNASIHAKSELIKLAFYDNQARYVLVPVYTGQEVFADEPQRDLDDCLSEFNDTSNPEAEELLSAKVLRQADVYELVTRGMQGSPIDLEILLYQWGEVSSPYSIYGQIAASDVASWWAPHYPQIVAPNIRMFLGPDTDVNIGLQQTLLSEPENFWHYNNGITVICREIRRKMIGGNSRDTGHFTVHDVSIVNGAQTAGSVAAAYGKKPDVVSAARVPIRFIAVGADSSGSLGYTITRATNTQNRISRQDFVALDSEQQRLRNELRIEGVTYNFKSGDGSVRDAVTFNIDEATVALACAHNDLSYSTQAKREIGRLWEDTTRAPYKALFNASTSSIRVWQCVKVMRFLDAALHRKQNELEGREAGFTVHGNRFLAHQVFRGLPALIVSGSDPLTPDVIQEIDRLVDDKLPKLMTAANELFPQAYLATLFKNQKKLTEISSRM